MCHSVHFFKMAEQAYTMDTHPHKRAQMPVSDGQPSANGETLQGPGPPPAAGPPWEVARAQTQAEAPSASGRRARKRPPLLSPSLPSSSQTAAPLRKAVPAREMTWRSPPTPPPASASPRHATACFATPPFLLGHLTSAFFHPRFGCGAFLLLSNEPPPTTHRPWWRRMRGVMMGVAYGRFSDCPSPSTPRVLSVATTGRPLKGAGLTPTSH